MTLENKVEINKFEKIICANCTEHQTVSSLTNNIDSAIKIKNLQRYVCSDNAV